MTLALLETEAEDTPRARTWPWLAAAALLYAFGRRELRRAALRGLLALGITRLLSLLPTPLRRHGVAAGATAFVTGAALESPAAGGALGIGAALAHGPHAGGSRIGAAGVGAAVALASTRVWPIPPELGPGAPKVWLPERMEPSDDGLGITIVVNSGSGNGETGSLIAELDDAFPKAELVEVEIEEGDELRKALDRAVENGAIALGIAGGDGSMNTAAQVALEAQKPLMVVPGGTFNHFTQALGIETVDGSIEAVKKGEAVGVDVATVGGRVFLNTASFGSYADLVARREKLEKRLGKWPALVIALLRVLRNGDPIDVEIDGEPAKVWMAFIGNCLYHPHGFAPTWRERLDDELIDFRYVRGDSPWARTRLVAAVLTGRLGRSKIYKEVSMKRLELRSLDGPINLARDGEVFEAPDHIVVEKLDKRLAVYVPHSKKP